MNSTEKAKLLRPVSGGICAPKGFYANALHLGIDGESDKKDFALIVAKERCVAAGSFPDGVLGATACLSQKRLKFACGQVIAVNSGIANLFLKNGEDVADDICRCIEVYTGISEEDVLVASTGKIGKPLYSKPFTDRIPELLNGLDNQDENSRAVAETIGASKQLSYAFSLAQFDCKIGAVFNGVNGRSLEQAKFVFLTTDVKITPQMLKKALHTEMKDTLDLLDVFSSPNDSVIIFASGKAENYTLDREDTDYKKFCLALKEILTEIAVYTLQNREEAFLICRIEQARSKQEARKIAKGLVANVAIKELFRNISCVTETLLFSVWQEIKTDMSGVSVYLQCGKHHSFYGRRTGDSSGKKSAGKDCVVFRNNNNCSFGRG